MKRILVVLLAASVVAAACSDSGDGGPATSGDALAEGAEAESAAGVTREGERQGTDEELYRFRFWGFSDDGSLIRPTVSFGGQEGGKKWAPVARDFPANWTVKVRVFDAEGQPINFAGIGSNQISATVNAEGYSDAFHKPLGEEIPPGSRVEVWAQPGAGLTDVLVDQFTIQGEPQGAHAIKLSRRGDGTVRAIAEGFPADWDGDLVKVYVRAPDGTENPWPAELVNSGVNQDDLLILRDLDPGDTIRVVHTRVVNGSQGTDEELYRFRFWGFSDDGSLIRPTVSFGGQEGGKKWAPVARDFPANWTVKVRVFDAEGQPINFAGIGSNQISATVNAEGYSDAFHKPLGEEIPPGSRVEVWAQPGAGLTDVLVDQFTIQGEPQGAHAIKLSRRGDGTVRAIAEGFPADWDGDLVKVYVRAPDGTENPWPAELVNSGVNQDDLLILRDLDPGDTIRVVHTPIYLVGAEIAAGPQDVVPIPDDLIGMTQEAAETRLRAGDFMFSIDYVADGGVAGTVVSTDPPPGTLISLGSSVVTVNVEVPDIEGGGIVFNSPRVLLYDDGGWVSTPHEVPFSHPDRALDLPSGVDDLTSSVAIHPGCSNVDLPENVGCQTWADVTVWFCSNHTDGYTPAFPSESGPQICKPVHIGSSDAVIYLSGSSINGVQLNNRISLIVWQIGDEGLGIDTALPPEPAPVPDTVKSVAQRIADLPPSDLQAILDGAGVLVPDNALPAQAVELAIPSNAIPSNAIPSNAIPSNAIPSNAIPSNAISSNAIPSN